jgi:hypothetical protein
MREPHARILGAALVFVFLVWSFPTWAGEECPVEVGSERVHVANEATVALSAYDREGEQTVVPSLRLTVPPLVLAVPESPLTIRVPAASRTAQSPDHSEETSRPWRLEGPPLPLRLAAVEELPTPVDASGRMAAQEQHWSSFLPLLAEEARRLGYDLPLPFGVSVVYNYLARDIKVTDVRLGVNGAELTSISDFANFNARSAVNAALVKADAWVFPFLNVYMLFGYIYNASDTNISGHGAATGANSRHSAV